MSSHTKPDIGNVIWTDTTFVSQLNVRNAWEIEAGERVFDRSGVEWDVIEVRPLQISADVYKVRVRLRQVRDAANEGEIICTPSEKFLLSVDGVVTG